MPLTTLLIVFVQGNSVLQCALQVCLDAGFKLKGESFFLSNIHLASTLSHEVPGVACWEYT